MPAPLKPLHIVQPEGVSFRMTDQHVLEWQSWKMHVGKQMWNFEGKMFHVIGCSFWRPRGHRSIYDHLGRCRRSEAYILSTVLGGNGWYVPTTVEVSPHRPLRIW